MDIIDVNNLKNISMIKHSELVSVKYILFLFLIFLIICFNFVFDVLFDWKLI